MARLFNTTGHDNVWTVTRCIGKLDLVSVHHGDDKLPLAHVLSVGLQMASEGTPCDFNNSMRRSNCAIISCTLVVVHARSPSMEPIL